MAVREASHAGSWYSSSRPTLARQIDDWLSQVPADVPGVGRLPLAGARVVIAPHAGYAYSGPCAAWAYKCLDLSRARRIFILHPSHHHHLSTAALPTVSAYETPLSSSPLRLDLDTIRELGAVKTTTAQNRPLQFTAMSADVDEAEHSCEMQLPYLHRLLQHLYPDQPESVYPPLVPIMIGSTNAATEAALGKVLAPYIADEVNVFVISSDFCHWGSRFGYTYYLSDAPSPESSSLMLPNGVRGENATTASGPTNEDIHRIPTLDQGQQLHASTKPPASGPRIYESIAHVDRACMCAIACGQHSEFARVLRETGNTVCGRHPIGVFMAGLQEVERTLATTSEDPFIGKFRFMRYERSSNVETSKDSSVSYVSAFAVI